MKKVLVTLFILLSFSLVFADEQEKKEPKVYTDEDLNHFKSSYDPPSKDKKSSSSSDNQNPCSWIADKAKECEYKFEDGAGREKLDMSCSNYWNKEFIKCIDDLLYGPPVRVRIVPR